MHSRARSRQAFTLIEVLAALLLMAIIVPVAMEGMSIATRAGVMGQRKVAAMRVADRLLNELIVTGEAVQAGSSGTLIDGGISYPWTLENQTWTTDSMQQLTVRVTFTVQGHAFEVAASTLIDPLAASEPAAGEVVD